MRFHADKRGLRALGIAESFRKGEGEKSVLAGVVMRGDMQIDGFGFVRITVGGLDATDGVLRLYKDLGRRDINILLLNGCVISWYNIIDLEEVHKALGIPVVCITYEESPGLEKYFMEFEDAEERLALYRRLGGREKVKLRTNHEIYVRAYGILDAKELKRVLDRFTLQGAVPEPLKVAGLLAAVALRSGFAR